MPGQNPGAPGAQGKLISAYEKTARPHLMASAVFSAHLHGRNPEPVSAAYTFHLFPHELHTQ
jgi:hypothetical protein